MPNIHEWLSGNAQRQYPFRESNLLDSSPLPQDFIVDLRMFLSAVQEIDIYLASIQYVSSADSYTLTFKSFDGVTQLAGTLSRLNGTASRIFKKTVLGSGEKVCVFTPGDLWNTPSWNGDGDWTLSKTSAESSVEPSVVLPGPATFRRLIIDELPDPFNGVYPLGGCQSLVEGYNVELSLGNFYNSSLDQPNTPMVEIEAGPGLGLGFPPAATPDLVIRTINGCSPDDNGNLILKGIDCLQVFTPVLDGLPLPNTQEIDSNCSVCCPCSDYQALSNEITALSAEVQALCNQLAASQGDALTAFNIGQSFINSKSSIENSPAVICRDPVLNGNVLSFSIQNMAPYPVYAYTSVSCGDIPPDELSLQSPNSGVIVSTAGTMAAHVASDMGSLPLLAAAPGGSGFPSNLLETGPAVLIRLGYPSQNDGQVHPIPPGGSCLVQLALLATPATTTVVQWRTMGVFGNPLSYVPLGHTISTAVSGSSGLGAHVFT